MQEMMSIDLAGAGSGSIETVKPVFQGCGSSLQLEVEEGSSGACKAISEAQNITISSIQLDQFIVILSLHQYNPCIT